MNSNTKGNLILLLTAFIWGAAFVAQSAGMDYVEPFTFMAARNVFGVLTLLPVIWVLNRRPAISEEGLRLAENREHHNGEGSLSKKTKSPFLPDKITLIGGVWCGIVLVVADGFQQVGIIYTTAGKAGFITALYIIIVPFMGLLIGKRIRKIIWLCVVLSIAGFYLLCINEKLSVSKGDLLELFCAIFFALHIIVIDYFLEKGADSVKMSCLQFCISGLLSFAVTMVLESPTLDALWAAKWPILYAGVLSSGVAYTLQIVGQKYTEPTIATLIMSLEAVFAAVTGWLLLHEAMTGKEIFGCALVFASVILAQIPLPKKVPSK